MKSEKLSQNADLSYLTLILKNVNILLKNVQKIACHLQCSLLKRIFVHLYIFVFKIITIYIDVSKMA